MIKICALGLAGLLLAESSIAQNRQSGNRELKQFSNPSNAQIDFEFLGLYEDMKFLEEIIEQNSPRTGPKVLYGYENGIKTQLLGLPPENIGSLMEDTFKDRASQIASRYGKSIPENASIFTFGNSVVASAIGGDSLIMDGNELIIAGNGYNINEGQSDMPLVIRTPYSKFSIIPASGGNFIIKAMEMPKGLIPYFNNGDFMEIKDKIIKYESALKKAQAIGYLMHPKSYFFQRQLEDIGNMLIDSIVQQEGLGDVLRRIYFVDVSVGGGRIIISARANFPYEKYRNRKISLSIGYAGDVKFWSKETDYESSNQIIMDSGVDSRTSYADLKINFPKPAK